MNPDLLRGNLDLILLSILEERPLYGLAIIQEARSLSGGYFDFKAGSLYPTLYRLEADGLLDTEYGELGGNGKPRKYYRISEKGRATLKRKRDEYAGFHRAMRQVREPDMAASTLQVADTHPRLLGYLRRATLGLPASRRQEFWDELEDHLLTRGRQLQALGLSPDAALERALAELGEASAITLGMGRVFHATRAALLLGLLSLIGAVWAVSDLPQPDHPIIPFIDFPNSPSGQTDRCYEGHDPLAGRPLQSPVGPLDDCRHFVAKQPLAPHLNLNAARPMLAEHGITLRKLNRTEWAVEQGGNQAIVKVHYVIRGEDYAEGSRLARALMVLNPSASLGHSRSGPALRTGGWSIGFGQRTREPGDLGFYTDLRGDFTARLGIAPWVTVDPAVPSDTLHRFKTGLPAGVVIMLLTRLPGNVYVAGFGRVGAGGEVSMRSAHQKLRFVQEVRQVRATPAGETAPALLLRVTGTPLNRLESGSFRPR